MTDLSELLYIQKTTLDFREIDTIVGFEILILVATLVFRSQDV